eukprot:1631056-Alexandrium_andersonii.AAC.1
MQPEATVAASLGRWGRPAARALAMGRSNGERGKGEHRSGAGGDHRWVPRDRRAVAPPPALQDRPAEGEVSGAPALEDKTP